MRKATIITLLMLACATSLLSAQTQTTNTPPNPATIAQHRVAYLTTVLSLTPTQQASANTIFTNAATTALGLRTQLKTQRQSLTTAVQNNDTATIGSVSTAIGSLVSQMVSNKATAYASFYQLLMPDQQSKFTQLATMHHRPGFRGGM
jgi:Spy/CpxP family protein refolding chaperone